MPHTDTADLARRLGRCAPDEPSLFAPLLEDLRAALAEQSEESDSAAGLRATVELVTVLASPSPGAPREELAECAGRLLGWVEQRQSAPADGEEAGRRKPTPPRVLGKTPATISMDAEETPKAEPAESEPSLDPPTPRAAANPSLPDPPLETAKPEAAAPAPPKEAPKAEAEAEAAPESEPEPKAAEPEPEPEPEPEVEEEPVDPEEAKRLAKAEELRRATVFGRILMQLGQVSRAQVASGLRMHRKMGIPLGECLLLQGAAGPNHVLDALQLQETMRASGETEVPEELRAKPEEPEPAAEAEPEATQAPEAQPAGAVLPPDPGNPNARVENNGVALGKENNGVPIEVTKDVFFGEVLLGAGMITNAQLEEAMHRHHKEGMKVGEALVANGVLTEEELENALELHQQLRRIANLSTPAETDAA